MANWLGFFKFGAWIFLWSVGGWIGVAVNWREEVNWSRAVCVAVLIRVFLCLGLID